jgi:type I restriction enzyme, S subunit
MEVNEANSVKDSFPHHSLDASLAELPIGYTRTDIGMIPDDWECRPLGELTTRVGSGLTPTGGARVYVQEGRPFLRSQNIGWGILNLEDLTYITDEIHANFRASEIRDGDVLLNITGASIGRSAVADARVAKGNVNQHVCGIRTDPGLLDPTFLNAYLLSESGQKQIDSFQAGGNRQGLNYNQIRSFLIPLPPITEQHAIAEALSDVDELLGALEALIAKKRAIKQGTMQQLLSGKTRLPGFSVEWEPKRLGDHLKFLRHGVNSRAELSNDERVRYLHYGDIHTTTDVFLDARLNSLPTLSTNRAKSLDRLQDGDLVLVDASEDLEGVRKSVEIKGLDQEMVSGLHTIAVRFDKDVLADGYKAYLQFCPDFRKQLSRLAAGTKVYATNRAHIASVEMLLPSTDEQIAIAAVLSDMDAEIAALEARRDKTRSIKKGMMQQLLTGRIRLVKPQPAEVEA